MPITNRLHAKDGGKWQMLFDNMAERGLPEDKNTSRGTALGEESNNLVDLSENAISPTERRSGVGTNGTRSAGCLFRMSKLPAHVRCFPFCFDGTCMLNFSEMPMRHPRQDARAGGRTDEGQIVQARADRSFTRLFS